MQRPVTITREALYKSIWQSSMRATADALGVTTTRLAMICERFSIPSPASSTTPTAHTGGRTELPALAGSTDVKLTITSATASLSPSHAPLEWKAISARRSNAEPIEGRYHPELARWLAGYQLLRRRYDPKLPAASPIPDKLKRQVRILDRLFGAARRRNLTPKLASPSSLRHICFYYEGAPILCELRETKKQVVVSRLGREHRENRCTGKLLFRIANVRRHDIGRRLEWHEKKIGPLSRHIEAIIDTIALAGPVVARENMRRQAHQARWEIQEASRQLSQTPPPGEARRWNAVVHVVLDYQSCAGLRALISEIEKNGFDGSKMVSDRSLAQWLTWSKQQLDSIDPTGGPIRTDRPDR